MTYQDVIDYKFALLDETLKLKGLSPAYLAWKEAQK